MHAAPGAVIRAVLDTNVIISAVISERGSPRRILEVWWDERFVAVTAPALVIEAERALNYDRIRARYGITDDITGAVMALLWIESEIVDDPPQRGIQALTGDPDDDVLVAIARRCRADVLVSGDSKMSGLRRVDRTRMLTPVEFAAELSL